MTSLARDPVVLKLARDLGLSWRGDCLAHVRSFALERVARLIEGFPVENLDALRRILANRLRMGIEFVRSEADLGRIAQQYASFDSSLGARVHHEFLRSNTEGIVLQRQEYDATGIRYLAVIDARGERAVRAYFTAWHELAHLLIYPPQLAFPGFRRSPDPDNRKDPLEAVVDNVAGTVAFYEPIYGPAVEQAVLEHGRLSFAAIDSARSIAAPEASCFAAAIAAVRYADHPVLLVRIGLGLKKAQAREARSGQGSFSFAPPEAPTLRALDVIGNDRVADSEFAIRRNMRVPVGSALETAFQSQVDCDFAADENQSSWETSQAGSQPPLRISVEAVRRGGHVYGLIGV
ncbi:MAG: hypothetical protein AB7K71_23110, partial [Polyangiaceae bacterium]